MAQGIRQVAIDEGRALDVAGRRSLRPRSCCRCVFSCCSVSSIMRA